MNNQEYEQKKRECWHSVNNNTHDFGIITLRCFTAIFDCAYALGKEKEAITQEEMEKAALEYIFNRQKARHNVKRDEEASLSDFDNTLKAWDAFDMAQAYEDGANYALGKEGKESEREEMLMVSRKRVQTKHSAAYKNEHSGMLSSEDVQFWRGFQCALADLFGSKCLSGGNSSNVDEIGKGFL